MKHPNIQARLKKKNWDIEKYRLLPEKTAYTTLEAVPLHNSDTNVVVSDKRDKLTLPDKFKKT